MKTRVNILFTFAEPVQISRLYRKPIITTQIVMTIDRVDEFIEMLMIPPK